MRTQTKTLSILQIKQTKFQTNKKNKETAERTQFVLLYVKREIMILGVVEHYKIQNTK